uniref:Major facilitator superfamily (MFS) profile domain-containing protein n=1 Tax=Megaselia scalaris TaxID=36166 RepID=T1GYI1_MEGSC
MYDIDFKNLESNTTPSADWPIVDCRFGWEYVYSQEDIPYESIASQNDWVCEKQSLSTVAQSFFFVGAIVGGLLFGYIADRSGRIPALIG